MNWKTGSWTKRSSLYHLYFDPFLPRGVRFFSLKPHIPLLASSLEHSASTYLLLWITARCRCGPLVRDKGQRETWHSLVGPGRCPSVCDHQCGTWKMEGNGVWGGKPFGHSTLRVQRPWAWSFSELQKAGMARTQWRGREEGGVLPGKQGRRQWLGLDHVKDLKGSTRRSDIRYASFKDHLGCCVESGFMRLKTKRVWREMSGKLLQVETLMTEVGGYCGRREKWTS